MSEFDLKFTSKLVTADDLSGWQPISVSEEVYEDGLCKVFQNEENPGLVLVNCITEVSEEYNMALLRDFYTQASPMADLKAISSFDYPGEYEFYAYHDHEGYPKYTILLEDKDFIFTASLITPNLMLGQTLEGRFDTEIDNLLYDTITLNLERN